MVLIFASGVQRYNPYLWSHFALSPFRTSETLRNCPELSRPFLTTLSFQFSCAFWPFFEFQRHNLALFSSNLVISKLTRSASSGRISKFDPPFDAAASVLFSALRINILQQVWKPLIHFFWKWEQNLTTNWQNMDCTESSKVFTYFALKSHAVFWWF